MKHILTFILGLVLSTSSFASCFEQSYSKEHLHRNPYQTVTSIQLILDSNEDTGEVQYTLSVTKRNKYNLYVSNGYCESSQENVARCRPYEGEGGFTLNKEHNSIMLWLSQPKGAGYLSMYYGRDEHDIQEEILESGIDDTNFRMYPVGCE